MEYDRDQNDYGPTSPSGDRYYYKPKSLGFGGGLAETTMDGSNKAEIDCLLCHMNASKNGQAWLQSEGCSRSNPIGPMYDPACSGNEPYGPSFPGAGSYTPGTAYDMFNRNLALKNAKFNLAASLGIGATATWTNNVLTGVTKVPSTIEGSLIASTPNSQNCAVCHARDDSTPGLPGMMQMKYGYGNYANITNPGESLDSDTGAANSVYWFELGCKTGMGKRAHRIGQGPNANWGMSMFNVMFGLGKKPGDPVRDESFLGGALKTAERMPDADIHEVRRDGSSTGMQCATCHYALGSTGLEGGMRTFPAGTHHGIAYRAETVYGIDHQFAQGDSAPDTKGKNNLDGTVSCESCHTTRDHPRLVENGGTLVAPTPTHAGFPAVHLELIACTTCHIPEVYAAPGRLKYRDWTVGSYKAGRDSAGGFRNMLDWNYDLVTGSHKPVPVLHAWITKEGEKKIVPFLPSVMPIWIKGNTVGNNPAPNDGDSAYPQGTMMAPVKHRDTAAAAEHAKADGLLPNVRLNGGNMVPLFDGFSLADSWAIDTKAEIDNMLADNPGFASKLKLFFTPFDITHGVAPKEWALGGAKRGGCVSCHSSANPASRTYSTKSAAFFESYQQPLNNAGRGIGQYDLIKNWFALFADYDCTQYANMMGNQSKTDDQYFNPLTGAPDMSDPYLAGCINQMTQGFDAMMGFPAGTAMQMGMFDGIAGLQGFTIRETVDGSTHGCNPFGGPSNSPVATAFGVSVNNCMPDAAHDPYDGILQGTCSGAPADSWLASCVGGFRNGQGCAPNSSNPAGVDADCIGTLASSTPLLYSRGEVRTHFKIALQQSTGGASYSASASRVTFPMTGFEKNPSNAAQNVTWDQAQRCYNPMTGQDVPCSDGSYIKTTVNANDFLGYDSITLAVLVDPAKAGIPLPNSSFSWSADPAIDYKVNFRAADCTTCNYSWAFGDGSAAGGGTASHTYSGSGDRAVTLSVFDSGTGLSSSSTQTVTARYVASNPTALTAAASSSGMVTNVTYMVTGGIAPYTIKIAWGDGTSSIGTAENATVSHTFAAAGTYNGSAYAVDSGSSGGMKTSATVTFTASAILPSVTGAVFESNGSTTISGVYLYLIKGTTTKKIAVSAANGTYSFTNVTPDTYTIKAVKSGVTFANPAATITVMDNMIENINAFTP